MDLADPRLKDKIASPSPPPVQPARICPPSTSSGAEKTRAFLHKLHDNGVKLLGGNAEVADQVGAGYFDVGLTDSDDVTNVQAHGGKLTAVVPDQDGEGTLAMPTTVRWSKAPAHPKRPKSSSISS